MWGMGYTTPGYGLISEQNISVNTLGRSLTFKAEESSSQLLIFALTLEVSLIDLLIFGLTLPLMLWSHARLTQGAFSAYEIA